jgi:hypothetical protein
MPRPWQINRRTFLLGAGSAVALPLLDAMLPTVARAATVAAPAQIAPTRMAFLYVPNGVTIPDWTPAQTGANYTLPRILQPLAEHKSDFSVLTGLAQHNGFALGDADGDHARASASFLTGVHPRKTAGADIRAGVSVDQVAAMKVGDATALRSLELTCETGRHTGSCDSGYACAYQYNLAWRSPTMPVNPESSPKQVFDRLFGDTAGGASASESAGKRALFRKSILDFVADDARRLESRVGQQDQRKLDEYLTAVREIERRVELSEKTAPRLPGGTRAPEMYESFEEHMHLMFDMLTLAFQTDSTRIATFIISHEGSNRPYPFINVKEGHHDLSHHQSLPDKIEKITEINTFHIQQLAYFLAKLKSIKEGDRTLLDNSMILYGSGISDGNAHNHDNLPILLAGRGNGTITPGRHIRAASETPLNNLYLSMLDRMGAPVDRFGDSTARFEPIA